VSELAKGRLRQLYINRQSDMANLTCLPDANLQERLLVSYCR
jgi:hypothetical protein